MLQTPVQSIAPLQAKMMNQRGWYLAPVVVYGTSTGFISVVGAGGTRYAIIVVQTSPGVTMDILRAPLMAMPEHTHEVVNKIHPTLAPALTAAKHEAQRRRMEGGQWLWLTAMVRDRVEDGVHWRLTANTTPDGTDEWVIHAVLFGKLDRQSTDPIPEHQHFIFSPSETGWKAAMEMADAWRPPEELVGCGCGPAVAAEVAPLTVCGSCSSPELCREPGAVCGRYCVPVRDLGALDDHPHDPPPAGDRVGAP